MQQNKGTKNISELKNIFLDSEKMTSAIADLTSIFSKFSIVGQK